MKFYKLAKELLNNKNSKQSNSDTQEKQTPQDTNNPSNQPSQAQNNADTQEKQTPQDINSQSNQDSQQQSNSDTQKKQTPQDTNSQSNQDSQAQNNADTQEKQTPQDTNSQSNQTSQAQNNPNAQEKQTPQDANSQSNQPSQAQNNPDKQEEQTPQDTSNPSNQSNQPQNNSITQEKTKFQDETNKTEIKLTEVENTFTGLDSISFNSGTGTSNELQLSKSYDSQNYDYKPIIKILIQQLLSLKFISHESELNIRGRTDYSKINGRSHWLTKDLAVHYKTNQLTKLEHDKYSFNYNHGKQEAIPLSIYFDLSPSMTDHAELLAVIAIELLRKGVYVILGENPNLYCQINKITSNLTLSEMVTILLNRESNNKVEMINIQGNTLDDYLINHQAEKCLIFSDFDPLKNIINLSHYCDVYFFNFKTNYNLDTIQDYEGFIYDVQNLEDIKNGLIQIKKYSFDYLVRTQKRKIRRK